MENIGNSLTFQNFILNPSIFYFNELLIAFLNIQKTKSFTPLQPLINDFGYENFKIKNRTGDDIGITTVTPKNISQVKTVNILIHGVGANRGTFQPFFASRTRFNHDSVFLLVDYGGYGDSTGNYTLSRVNNDIETVVYYVSSKYPGAKINLIGHSHGAAVVIEYFRYMASKRQENRINRIVLLAPYLSIDGLIGAYVKNIPMFLSDTIKLLSANFDYDNKKNIRLIDSSRLLIIHGKQDIVIPAQQSAILCSETQSQCLFTNDSHTSLLVNPTVQVTIHNFLES